VNDSHADGDEAGGAVDVAVVALDVGPATFELALALLDARERAAADARHEPMRRRYVVAHAALRIVVGDRLGLEAASVKIESEPTGRPLVAGLAVSLTHSGDRALIATAAPDVLVGVDVERVRERARLDRLAARVFDAPGYRAWCALPSSARPQAFAQRWTEVEALLKARGTGIAGGLASAIDVSAGWARAAIAVGDGYVGAVALNRPALTVAVRSLDLDRALTSRGAAAR
jgi:4'-phosphopantetheinyl transferase